MNKLAQLKSAEVAGVISGLIDGGYLKLASENDFETLTEAVAGNLSDNWDLNEVLDKTAEVLSAVEPEAEKVAEIEKSAEEKMQDILADYGYLCLSKEAEEISDEDFFKEAVNLKGAVRWLRDGGKAYGSDAAKAVADGSKKALKAVAETGAGKALTGKDARDYVEHMRQRGAKPYLPELLAKLKKPALAYGGAAVAAGAGAALSSKKNRDAMAAKMKKVRAAL